MKTTERMSTMSGTVAHIDLPARRLTIAGLVMNKTFDLADDLTVLTSVKPGAILNDLKVGDEVDVTYEQLDTLALAHLIHQAHVADYHAAA